MIQTVADLMKTLEQCMELYPEFEKYNICIDIANDGATLPKLVSPQLFIDTDIGQVEIFGEDE